MVKIKRRVKHRPKPLCQPAMLMFGDIQSVKLEELVRKMELDDILIQPPWRLEYVDLKEGFVHYRLLYEERLIGIRDVTSRKRLLAIHRGLAAYLAQVGARPELALIIKGGKARAVLSAAEEDEPIEHKELRVEPLFMFVDEKRKGRRTAGDVRVYSLSTR